jgi:hypothetical protein
MEKSNKITVGQIFRVPYRGLRSDTGGPLNYQDITRGIHEKSADSQKGMFFYQHVKEPDQKFNRLPAFIFLSNPFPTEISLTVSFPRCTGKG